METFVETFMNYPRETLHIPRKIKPNMEFFSGLYLEDSGAVFLTTTKRVAGMRDITKFEFSISNLLCYAKYYYRKIQAFINTISYVRANVLYVQYKRCNYTFLFLATFKKDLKT